jgi:penicillin-binding protein 1C
VRRFRRAALALCLLTVIAVISFHAAVAWWPYPADRVRNPRDATIFCDSDGQSLCELVAPDGQWRTTLSESEISPHLFDAIVAIEDARFFDHRGVDWRAAAAATFQDLLTLRPRRGASTITMQLHRLRVPTSHTFWGKLEQAVRAAQIERTRSKRQILVEYLNRAPFGGNLIGAGAASARYFGRPCRELSLAQAALRAGLPRNPNGDRPDRFPERARSRRGAVLARMRALNMISADQYATALDEPINAAWRSLPQNGHPAIQAALPALALLAAQSPGGRTRTTIDHVTQELVAASARQSLDQQGGQVTEVAVVVLETSSARCVACVSLSRSGASAVATTRRPRSTGSIIKPIIYATAFDAGLSSPQSILDDSPAAWPGYAPANYDQEFLGRITAAEALAQSRNIPALRLLSRVGVTRAANVCGALGLQTLSRTPQRYGLSLAVGGAEATPLEVAQAYATLARGGCPRAVTLRLDDAPAVSLDPAPLSAQACRQALDCLSDPQRTAALAPEAADLRIAWKTGTSSGHRDAWCAAVGPRHVAVVWMGNATGPGARTLIGAEAAAPLALHLLAAIDAGAPVAPPATVLATAPPITHPLQGVSIVAPAPRTTILVDPERNIDRQRVQLRARAIGAAEPPTLFWFMDGAPLGSASGDQPFWWSPTPGTHELRVIDSAGNADRLTLTVARP